MARDFCDRCGGVDELIDVCEDLSLCSSCTELFNRKFILPKNRKEEGESILDKALRLFALHKSK